MEKGYTAVTCGGSGDWKSDASILFQNANVIVLADNDKPGGKLASTVVKDLKGIRLFIAEDTEKIVFHRSEEVINFWRENCIGDVTVIMIPGNHLTCFTDVNNIQKLVNMITEK